MSSHYIDLNRSFLQIPTDQKSDEDDYDFASYYGHFSEIKKWDDLHSYKRVIILAEAGAGKTAEIKAITKKLRDKGKISFFLRLEALADSDFESTFEIGTNKEFNEWQSGTEPGWFFLDSVDEAKLSGFKRFENGIKRFSIKLGEDNFQRAHVFITSRISEWRAATDSTIINELLPLSQSNSDNSIQIIECYENECNTSISSPSLKKNTTEAKQPLVFALQSLDTEQIKLFVNAHEITSSSEFLNAVKRADAEAYCTRPLDLLELIYFWKENSRIADPKELIESSIKTKLSEWDRERESQVSLTYNDAREGAELLALAVLFLKKTRIHFPEPGTDIKDAIDIQKVLKDWDYKKCSALLQRPIFDEAIYGTVRFHHRSVYEYLAACRIAKILANANSIRKIERLFFTERYGQQIVVKSMRPILAWLVLFDGRIRDKTMKLAPEIFLQGGDPTALSISFRDRILRDFCKKYSNELHWSYSFSFSEVYRFSHPDLTATINQLISEYSDNEEIIQLLMLMIWKGNIQGCIYNALECAIDSKKDRYTRIYAIWAVAISNNLDLKTKLIEKLVNDLSLVDGKIIGTVISTFAPEILNIKEIIKFIQRVENDNRLADDWLFDVLKEFSKCKCPNDSLSEWLESILLMLCKPPVVEEFECDISSTYHWLLPYAIYAAERLVMLKHPSALSENVLKSILFAQQNLPFWTIEQEKHELGNLIPVWPELNYKLFWYHIKELRKKIEFRNTKLEVFSQINCTGHYWSFGPDHFNVLLNDITIQTLTDNRSVALTACIYLCRAYGRKRKWTIMLRNAVAGVPELEAILNNYLNPPPISADEQRIRKSNAYYKKRLKIREEKEYERVKEFKAWLRENVNVIRDNSIAANVKKWETLQHILRQLEIVKPNKHWAQSNWQSLIPEFGIEVAEAFRDGCIGFWRRNSPEVRSEMNNDGKKIRNMVIYGSCGLEMECKLNSIWPNSLSENEVKIACRYAINGIDSSPSWIKKLHSIFPDIVNESLLTEIEWEFKLYNGEQPCYHVLSAVASRLDWIKPIIASRIIEFLQLYEPKHDDTLKNAFEIVLLLPDLKYTPFVDVGKEKVRTAISLPRTALWLGTLMCVNANIAMEVLISKLKTLPLRQDATEFVMQFLVSLFYWKKQRDINCDYLKVEILLQLIKIAHEYVSADEDKRAGGIITLRDNAQDSRRYLFELLLKIPGKETYKALLDLAENDPEIKNRNFYLMHAKRRAEDDAEPESWQIDNITEFLNEIECTPKNHRELFELTKYRLFDLKDDLEQGDTSLSALLSLEKDETKYRNFIGGWLRDKSRGKYCVPQEEELADKKRPDLRIHRNGFDAPIPIELKIADNNWTVTSLQERLENQLCGDYLRDNRSNCGIFLVIYRGEKGSWEHPVTKENLNFAALLEILTEKANMIIASSSKIEAIEVIGIDLTLRTRRNGNVK